MILGSWVQLYEVGPAVKQEGSAVKIEFGCKDGILQGANLFPALTFYHRLHRLGRRKGNIEMTGERIGSAKKLNTCEYLEGHLGWIRADL